MHPRCISGLFKEELSLLAFLKIFNISDAFLVFQFVICSIDAIGCASRTLKPSRFFFPCEAMLDACAVLGKS